MGDPSQSNAAVQADAPGASPPAGGEARVGSAHAFLAHMRHELRTPINAILGYSEMLLEDADESLGADLKRIHTAGAQLLSLVNDILDPIKVDAQADVDVEAFGASIRHALRTPINTVTGYCEMLLEDCGESDAPDLAADLHRIHQAGERLLALSSDVVNLWEVQAGKAAPALSEGDAPEMVLQAMETIHAIGPVAPREAAREQGAILVVDDVETNRDLLGRCLARDGYAVTLAEDGFQALEKVAAQSFDAVLLDIMMPGMNGYQVLQHLKGDERLCHLPVIMISALDEIDTVVRCIEIGAEDYLPKPFNPVLLKARVGACLEKKRLRDREQAYLEQIRLEREESERLLLSILPKPTAERLKQGETLIADSYPEATVLFADLVGFTSFSSHISPGELVHSLNLIFTLLDDLVESHGLEKIKTIGDAYMAAGGVPTPNPRHAEAAADMALEAVAAVNALNAGQEPLFSIRIGIDTGPVVAGVIGTKRFIYDLWGDAVNTASRMESTSVPNEVQITEATRERLGDRYLVQARGIVPVKGKGPMRTYFLRGRR